MSEQIKEAAVAGENAEKVGTKAVDGAVDGTVDGAAEGADAVAAEDADAEMEDDALDYDKIKLLPGASEDGTIASFQIQDEDHTLGNALRYIIMKNPEVEFCGYSIPHPSEKKLNLRIQTYGDMTAVQALHKGLDDLTNLCSYVEDTFMEKVGKRDYSTEEP